MTSPLPFYDLTKTAIDDIEEILDDLIDETRVSCALVIDQSGYVLANRGLIEQMPVEELAAVVAGCFASLSTITQSREMTFDFHTRGFDNMYLGRVNSRSVLLALYNRDCDTKKLREKGREASKLIRSTVTREETFTPELGSLNFISAKLDELFKGA